jgi:hypothetical protein
MIATSATSQNWIIFLKNKSLFYFILFLKPWSKGKDTCVNPGPASVHGQSPLGTLFWPASVGWLLDRTPSTKDLTRLVWPDTIPYLLVLFSWNQLKIWNEREFQQIFLMEIWWGSSWQFSWEISWDFRWVVWTWFVIHVYRWTFQKFPIGAMKMWKLVHVVYCELWCELWLTFHGRRNDALYNNGDKI